MRRLAGMLLLCGALAAAGCSEGNATTHDAGDTADLAAMTADFATSAADLATSAPDLTLAAGPDLLGADLVPASPPYHPFGAHAFPYAAGVIFPTENQAARDTAVKAAYDAWKTTYLVDGCATDRTAVEYSAAANGFTVSEAHGYGMIITALMAGYDAEAQTLFDGMVRYYDAHRSTTDLTSSGHATNLFMSWRQNDQCENIQGETSATDGDVDIAYALLLADAQWGSTGAIDYRTRGLAIIDLLMDALIEGAAATTPKYLVIGDWAVGDNAWDKRTRTSDFILAEFRAFRSASGDSRWDDAILGMQGIAASLQTNHAASTGLLPDFVEAAHTTSPSPVAPNTLESANDGEFGANACRTPWRVGQDAVFTGNASSKAIVEKMTAFFRDETNDDPKKICSGYTRAGAALDACDWHSLEYIAPLGVAAMVSASHQAWLDAIWAIMKTPSLVSSPRQYYGDTINVLTMLVVSGNWWQP